MQSLDAPAIHETVKGILFSLCDVKAKKGRGEERRGCGSLMSLTESE